MMLRFGNTIAITAWLEFAFGMILLELWDLTFLLGYHGRARLVAGLAKTG